MMYFIHIATYTDGEDFTSWLDGQNKLAFNDSEDFKTWLEGRKVFPLEIYLDGVTMKFNTKESVDYFRLGFDTAMRLRLKSELD